MRILLCNDDGIGATGLRALHRAIRPLGDITVVAPAGPKSASSHAVTIGIPITCRKVHVHDEFWGYSVAGSPADCVKLALAELMPQRPDLVVSGINHGTNVGIDVFYSGTVAAAAEGALFGLPSLAISQEVAAREPDFERAAQIARQVIDALLETGLTSEALLNINIPALRAGVPKGVRVAKQSTLLYEDRFLRQGGTDEEAHYLLTGGRAEQGEPPETDLHALREGYVSITPLKFDLTDHASLARLSDAKWPSRL